SDAADLLCLSADAGAARRDLYTEWVLRARLPGDPKVVHLLVVWVVSAACGADVCVELAVAPAGAAASGLQLVLAAAPSTACPSHAACSLMPERASCRPSRKRQRRTLRR